MKNLDLIQIWKIGPEFFSYNIENFLPLAQGKFVLKTDHKVSAGHVQPYYKHCELALD